MSLLPVRAAVGANDLVPTAGDRTEQLQRIRAALQSAGLQAYVAFTPSNVHYVSGYESYFLSTWWRMHGKIFAAVSADESRAPALVLGDAEDAAEAAAAGTAVFSYPMWVEPASLAQIQDARRTPEERPAQWSEEAIDRALADVLRSYGITRGRVGCDLQHMTHDAYLRLRRVAPDVEWIDFTDGMYEVRVIKFDYEIARLQAASELADAGMLHAVAGAFDGAGIVDLHSGFVEGAARHARTDSKYAGFSTFWVLPAFGKAANINAAQTGGLARGDLIKFDCGTTVLGYRSDHGRTFAYGEPAPQARALHETLKAAHDAALLAVRPGALPSEVFAAAEGRVRRHGYPNYNRGHFGHSVGMDTFHEEPPFLGRHETRPLQTGMVLAIETPFYGNDVGSIMIEDLVLVTETGAEVLSPLARELVSVAPR
ncbi:M24 family metallopeptidase [Microbacterium betulae]|uniref:M24 family metallopeptidase n=1 Tax=Microbacterium betulae TaxID=2981139 RepID=A0AA97FH43_9MICO|nr:M24 family metallopeptidase [Microbacterium sp. AB]WOF22563.1 M24 family metallopeptidase [Microbacterium sp. AB]